MSRTIVFTGGGTGGHIFPGVAVAHEIRRLSPSTPILWIGAEGRLEETLVPDAGLTLRALPVRFLQGTRGWRRLAAVGRLPGTVVRAACWLRQENVGLVVSLGGFAAGPASAAAILLGVPLVLMEQNARPGLTHRWTHRFAEAVLAALPPKPGAFGDTTVRVVGNPVRRSLLEKVARAALPAPGEPWEVLVMGGSQGARIFNHEAPRWARALGEAGHAVRWTHLCGAGRLREVEERWAKEGLSATVQEFSSQMESLYSAAHVVLARAGATTVAELCALGLPALYVPFAAAADDHQTANAEQVVAVGGAVCVSERDAARQAVIERLHELLSSPDRIWEMGVRARSLGHPSADRDVATRLLARMRGDAEWLDHVEVA